MTVTLLRTGTIQNLSRRTLREAQKIIGLVAVVLRLDVLVASRTGGHDDPYRMAIDAYPEPPCSRLDSRNSILLGNLPPCPIIVEATDVLNTLMRVVAIGLVDTADLMIGHGLVTIETLAIPAPSWKHRSISLAETGGYNV